MKTLNTRLFSLLFFTAMSLTTFGQGVVRGNIYERATETPIPFAAATLYNNGVEVEATISNIDGFYQINNVPAGTYTLVVNYIGYSEGRETITVKNGENTFTSFYLDETAEVLEDVEVSAERQIRQTSVMTATVNLSSKNIQQFSIGGEPDLVRALQVLPGVVTTGDQGGQLYIRGGAPIQNLTLLDGMIIYNPFHSIGFFSVFDTDILRSAEVHSAGFNAEYASRNSSVLDVRTRAGNRQRVTGKVSASTYLGKALLEVPIGKKNEQGFAPVSALVSYKRSFLAESSQIFYPYVETEYDGLPFEFQDIYGKMSWQSGTGSEVNIFGFNFADQVRFAGDKSIAWNSLGYGADFTAIPPSSTVIINGNFAFSEYDITSNEIEGQPRNSSITGFNGGLDFTYFMRDHDELKYGLEAIGYSTNFNYVNSANRTLTQEQSTSELGAYFQYKLQLDRWLIEPGIRLHYYSALAEFRFEPRFGVKYNATEWLRFKASGGMYSQNLLAATSDRDVVNLFYGFLSSPNEQPATYTGEPLDTRLQTANHGVFGVEIDFADDWTLDLEGYVKDFQNITTVNRNKIYPDNSNYLDRPEYLRRSYIAERGLAYGFDVLLKYSGKQFSFWGTYSYAEVTRDDGQQVYNPHFDRRHNTNLVAAYKFGKSNSWEVNVRWNLGTGFPFTPVAGYYQQLPWTDGDGQPVIDYPYETENGQLGTLYGDLNSKRLPTYHRMDVTIKKTWKLSKYSTFDLAFAATNVYNRNNIFYYDSAERKRVDQLPIMPTLIATYGF
ncbi:TonB-dependent receptor [Phaeocystidibacter luteus]|uniref:TonB-dependent receptor plug domain-containing protein n=1 Tax=Phaeocystidibacter luteus TaxID=911197 RepID=A0A6N6RF29_9FLAO|nr:TonB-dependent receptor [Phaeocystidibacter luteus]KAB2809767.1 TonB-dependent receptor plug domain-containing protein [Phaeocystidibacter luteus]